MKQFEPINYNPNKNSFFVYVEPKPEETETREITYEWVIDDYKYAHYWSNNWRKVHGFPLRRKRKNLVVYLKPHLLTEKETTELRDIMIQIDEMLR